MFACKISQRASELREEESLKVKKIFKYEIMNWISNS